MTSLAPVVFEVDIKSPVSACKTPVQKRLEQQSPKGISSPAIDEKLAKSEEARKVRTGHARKCALFMGSEAKGLASKAGL